MKIHSSILKRLEISIDGKDYFLLEEEGEETETETHLNIVKELLSGIIRKNEKLNKNFLEHNFNGFHFRISNASSDCISYDKHIQEQQFLFNSLTKREKQVLAFIYRKYPPKKILPSLAMSLNTYKTYRKNIFLKLNFKTKIDLVIWCEKYLNICLRNYFRILDNKS